MKKTITMALLLSIVGCSNNDAQKTTNATPEMVASAQPEKPKLPEHNYSLEDDGEYGYERGISENDEKDGRKANPIMMVRYLGEKDGTYTVQLNDGQSRVIFSCQAPCEFVKTKQYFAGELIKTETMRNAEGSVIWAVMQDAQSGKMTPYSARQTSRR